MIDFEFLKSKFDSMSKSKIKDILVTALEDSNIQYSEDSNGFDIDLLYPNFEEQSTL